MKLTKIGACLCFLAVGFTLCATAQGAPPRCKRVHGNIVWTVIPVPDGDHARVVGSVSGSLKGSSSATILELNPPANGALTTHDQDIFVTGAQDLLVGDSHATFTFTATPGVVLDSQSMTIVGGTGAFDGATGTLELQGKGYNFPPSPGGPVTFFNVAYRGQICGARLEEVDLTGGADR